MAIANQTSKQTGSGGNTKPSAKVDIGKQLFPSNPQAAMWYNMSVQHGASPQNAYSQVRNQQAARAATGPIFPQNGNGPNPSMNPMVTQPLGTGGFDPWNTQSPTYYNPPTNGQKLGGVSMGTPTGNNSQVINPGQGGYGQLFSGNGSSYNSHPQMGYGTLYGGLVDERFSDGVERTTPQSQLDVSLASGMSGQNRFTMAQTNNGGYGWNPGQYPMYGANGPSVIHTAGANQQF